MSALGKCSKSPFTKTHVYAISEDRGVICNWCHRQAPPEIAEMTIARDEENKRNAAARKAIQTDSSQDKKVWSRLHG